MAKIDYQDKARGMLVGLAVGDALGAPVEFNFSSKQIKSLGNKIEKYYTDGDYPTFWEKHGYPHGAWTDDTSMALCLADSLLEKEGYDSYDIMDKFSKWLFHGYRSSSHRAIGAGQQTTNSLFKYKYDNKVNSTPEKSERDGNGAIMRLAPVIIANVSPIKNSSKISAKTIAERQDKQLHQVRRAAILSCRETHNSVIAEAVTEMFATMLFCALIGEEKPLVKGYGFMKMSQKYSSFWFKDEALCMAEQIDKSDTRSLQDLQGYALYTFAIALWGLMNFDNFKDGMMAVIRLGGDTDTSAACYGQIAGAYYGYEAIPKEWRKEVYLADELVEIADKLLAMPKCPILRTRFENDECFQKPE